MISESGAVLEKETDAADMESLRRELEEKGHFILNIRPSVSSTSGGVGAAKGWGIASLPLFRRRRIKDQGSDNIQSRTSRAYQGRASHPSVP
ncbi:MAG: hypothetical protein HY026_03755 [Deltaproteobacteria bacterium]|nr:hypothetical protein [Deltaproteobacteria bacterium]